MRKGLVQHCGGCCCLLSSLLAFFQHRKRSLLPTHPWAPLDQWLHRGAPAWIAWGADFARRTLDAKIVAEIPALLERWTHSAGLWRR